MQIVKRVKLFYKAGRMSFLYGAVSVSAVVGFIPHLPQIGVYVVLIVFALCCLVKPHTNNPWLVALLIYIPIELLLAQPNPLFKSWPRYVMFALLLMCVSPLFDGEYHRLCRRRLMQILLWTCTFLGVGSFFARYLGINFMAYSQFDMINKVGLFGGLTTHSMLLGPISGIGAIFMCYKAFKTHKKIYWCLAVLCIVSIMFSASRSALIASLAGIVLTIYKLSGKASKFVQIGVLAVVLASISFPIWGGILDGIIEKNVGNTTTLDVSSRQGKWDLRIEEFQKSPLFGVGFASVAINIASEEYDPQTGVVEPGSSWLCIFSMMGLIGALITIPFLIKAYYTIWRRADSYSAIIIGILSLMYIHMLAEGYIFSGGSFMCFILWLSVGVAYDSRRHEFTNL